ncbi:hypothetical protein BDV41DRAFT_575276 [Aspergillus transmontanensis]|uniref:Uncharacterized protein n=1 Tax=Aspergillus transmontanensis TaxID=1034304 RepID=A0A5N6W2S7_9EURO|nr:hypothetical protein BDV41DRAFT_575276 [Aspergillus transmontanensis]
MAHLEAPKHISPDSVFHITLHPKFNPKIKQHVPPDSIPLFSVAKPVDLTESIGTLLENVQLSQLNEQQLDELALLGTERGVVLFRDRDLTTEKQVELFQHYGVLDKHPAQRDQKFVNIHGSREDHREIANYIP